MSQNIFHSISLVDEDKDRCRSALLKLARHMNPPVVLTGGLAVGWHNLQNNLPSEPAHLNDLDLVVDDLSAIYHSISQDFLIAHFHPSRPRGKILIQLVDEENRLRIDIFTSCSMTLKQRLQPASMNEIPLRIIAAEDLLARLCAVLSSVTKLEPVEPKYVHSFNRLLAIADLATLKMIWTDYRNVDQPVDFEEAAASVRQVIADHPDLLQKGDYSLALDHQCLWCEQSPIFPVAPPAKVFDILGYV